LLIDHRSNGSYEIRKGVANGVALIDIHQVENIAKRLPVIEEVSYSFGKQLYPGWLSVAPK